MRETGRMLISKIFAAIRPPFFFFNDTATTEIYTLSLHDALPIYILQSRPSFVLPVYVGPGVRLIDYTSGTPGDRKSTRLNSSHTVISYAVFCLKKKKQQTSRGASAADYRRYRGVVRAAR